MSVNEIETIVLLFPSDEWADNATNTQLSPVVSQLRPNISYDSALDENLQTLSTHDADVSGTIAGFLYVPDLERTDPCYNLSKNYVPANVTRQANLPLTDFTLIALAPWISAQCTLAYLAAADLDPMRAFIFYLPNNGTSQPPPPSSSAWDLGDGGSWKTQHAFPVYAIPSNIGQEMMHQSSLYSSNVTDVPYGHQISELPGVDPRDYVRLYTELHVSNSTSIPLWALLLVIVAVLFLMVIITSGARQLILRSQRKSLQRRVAIGEVNLEALGIKRLTVPQEYIDKIPLFTYHQYGEKLPPASSSPRNNSISTTTEAQHHTPGEGSIANHGATRQDQPVSLLSLSMIAGDASSPGASLTHNYLPDSQPTCPICLDDFESGTTPIRELPCGHIFHPRCIDSFLSSNSSLCPMCKKSVLPKGYCPTKITNSMVRRERNIRRLRSRVIIDEEEHSVEPDNFRNRIRRFGNDLRRFFDSTRPPRSYPDQQGPIHMVAHPVMTNAVPGNTNTSVLRSTVLEDVEPERTYQESAL